MRSHKLLDRRLAGAMAAWALVLGACPTGAWAFPSASSPVFQGTGEREAMVESILSVLSRPQAQIHLRMAGIRPSELKDQLLQLDDAQLADVAARAETIKAGGDALGIVIVLLVIAILFVILIYLLDKDVEIVDDKD